MLGKKQRARDAWGAPGVVAACPHLSIQSNMRLVFVHGPPAAGKLTVAQALLRLVPGRLFDNHAAIDVARTVLDFGAPGFWELVQTVRLMVIEAAAAQGVPLLVATYCYAEPDDRPAFEQIEGIVLRYGGELLPVFLQCAERELIRRVGNADRATRGKTSSEEGLRNFLVRYRISPVPRANCLTLDSETRTPAETAREIVRHFRLDSPDGRQQPSR